MLVGVGFLLSSAKLKRKGVVSLGMWMDEAVVYATVLIGLINRAILEIIYIIIVESNMTVVLLSSFYKANDKDIISFINLSSFLFVSYSHNKFYPQNILNCNTMNTYKLQEEELLASFRPDTSQNRQPPPQNFPQTTPYPPQQQQFQNYPQLQQNSQASNPQMQPQAYAPQDPNRASTAVAQGEQLNGQSRGGNPPPVMISYNDMQRGISPQQGSIVTQVYKPIAHQQPQPAYESKPQSNISQPIYASQPNQQLAVPQQIPQQQQLPPQQLVQVQQPPLPQQVPQQYLPQQQAIP